MKPVRELEFVTSHSDLSVDDKGGEDKADLWDWKTEQVPSKASAIEQKWNLLSTIVSSPGLLPLVGPRLGF